MDRDHGPHLLQVQRPDVNVTLPELMKSGYSEYTHGKGGHLQINRQKKHFGAVETHGDGMHVIVKHYAACGSESSGLTVPALTWSNLRSIKSSKHKVRNISINLIRLSLMECLCVAKGGKFFS